MLVYGDHEERRDPQLLIRDIDAALERVRQAGSGLPRHSQLVSTLILAGRLLQGVADSDFRSAKLDRATAAVQELNEFLLALGRAVCRSWDSGFADVGPLPSLCLGGALPDEIAIKQPEGYAFYALYPEAYIEAARRLGLQAPPRVIGIRSIGTSLGAVVAAALDAPPPVTVRPFGDPYDRSIAIGSDLARDLLAHDAHFIIVDEGPGQSGSSFAAVGEWLEQHGVERARIALLPSHSGAPGGAATQERRRWWGEVRREVADLGARLPQLLASWCTDLLGPFDAPLQEISGGEWRQLVCPGEADWPATVPAWERRKFLAYVGGEPILLRFAGLGSMGEQKLGVARALWSERLVPEPIGLVHGFLAERWCAGTPLGADEKPVAELARYIAARANLLRAPSGSGASPHALLEMAKRNISLEFGDDAAGTLHSWEPRLSALDARSARVRTDNKLDRHEWLRTSEGTLVKTDATDHHQAHDLIGCQSVEWDIAGAIVEFELEEASARRLVHMVEEAFGRTHAELLAFSRLAYLAFQLGQARMGAQMEVGNGREARRLNLAGDLYAAQLRVLLESSRASTRPNSPVG